MITTRAKPSFAWRAKFKARVAIAETRDSEVRGSRLASLVHRVCAKGGVEVFSTGFVSLGNLFVEPSGNLLVADRGGHRVYRVTTTGANTAIAGNASRTGVVTDNLLSAPDLMRSAVLQVWYIDGIGTIHLFVDGDNNDSHAGDGLNFDDPAVRISEPRGVTMDPAGNVLITEHDGGFIRRVNYTPKR